MDSLDYVEFTNRLFRIVCNDNELSGPVVVVFKLCGVTEY